MDSTPPHHPIRTTDPPQGQERWEAVEGGFSCAMDLVAYIREHYGTFFSVGVAGYPEVRFASSCAVAPCTMNHQGRLDSS